MINIYQYESIRQEVFADEVSPHARFENQSGPSNAAYPTGASLEARAGKVDYCFNWLCSHSRYIIYAKDIEYH